MSEQHILPLLLKSLRLGSLVSQWEPMADKAREQSWSVERYLAELVDLNKMHHHYQLGCLGILWR